jgi:hypothetical protein
MVNQLLTMQSDTFSDRKQTCPASGKEFYFCRAGITEKNTAHKPIIIAHHRIRPKNFFQPYRRKKQPSGG